MAFQTVFHRPSVGIPDKCNIRAVSGHILACCHADSRQQGIRLQHGAHGMVHVIFCHRIMLIGGQRVRTLFRAIDKQIPGKQIHFDASVCGAGHNPFPEIHLLIHGHLLYRIQPFLHVLCIHLPAAHLRLWDNYGPHYIFQCGKRVLRDPHHRRKR